MKTSKGIWGGWCFFFCYRVDTIPTITLSLILYLTCYTLYVRQHPQCWCVNPNSLVNVNIKIWRLFTMTERRTTWRRRAVRHVSIGAPRAGASLIGTDNDATTGLLRNYILLPTHTTHIVTHVIVIFHFKGQIIRLNSSTSLPRCLTFKWNKQSWPDR